MKKQFLNARQIFSVLAIAGLLAGTANESFARRAKQNIETSALGTPKVEHVTTNGSEQVFKVSFDAKQAVKFNLSITDEQGDLLYNETFEASTFNKYVKLVNQGGDYAPAKFYFTLRELSSGIKHSFGVSNETVFVNDVVITKL